MYLIPGIFRALNRSHFKLSIYIDSVCVNKSHFTLSIYYDSDCVKTKTFLKIKFVIRKYLT